MSASKVFVVMGETGEYSDRKEWPVIAYLDEASAKNHVLALDAWLREHRMHMDGTDFLQYEFRQNKPATDLDSSFEVDYTGTRYYVMEVSLGVPRPVDA